MNSASVSTSSPDIVAYPMQRPEGVVLDMDGTLYVKPEYHAHAQAVDRGIYAKFLLEKHGVPDTQVDRFITDQRKALGSSLGIGRAGLTQTLQHLGMGTREWHEGRGEGYQPHEYFQPNADLLQTIDGLLARYKRVAVASNSPLRAVEKVLTALGVSREILQRRLRLFAVDTLDVCKPDPNFFRSIAEHLDVDPQAMMSIGNEADKDAYPAVEAGMGAAIISDPMQIGAVLAELEETANYRPVDIQALVNKLFVPGKNRVVGIVGRAGAGKSTVTKLLVEEMNRLSALNCRKFNGHAIGLDAFFRLSSADRAKWLDELGIDPDERARREDQALWWDFDQADQVLRALSAGRPVHIEGVYTQQDRDKKSGVLDVQPAPSEEGNIFFIEGVGVPELAKRGIVDELVYVNAHESVRHMRVYERDKRKRGEREARRRWGMTQGYEDRMYGAGSPYIDGCPVTVIDNSLDQNGELHLRQLPGKIPSR